MSSSNKTEFVTLEEVDGVTVKANKYIETGELASVVGHADPEAKLTFSIWNDLHFVRWVTPIPPESAQAKLLNFDSHNRHRRFHIDREDENQSNIRIRRRAFATLTTADAVELHSEGGDTDPVLVWRKPLDDELPHNRFIAYFPNIEASFPDELAPLIDQTMLPEAKPTDLQRTLNAFHTIFTKYADLVRG